MHNQHKVKVDIDNQHITFVWVIFIVYDITMKKIKTIVYIEVE